MSTTSPPPKIACPHCQGQIKAPSLAPGSMVNCPKCGKGFALGAKAEAVEVRGQRSESRGQKAEVREQRSQDAGAKSPASVPPQLSRPATTPQPPVPKPNLPRAHSGTRGVVTPPDQPVHQPVAQLAAGDLVPVDAGTAAAATQPAHRPPAKHDPAKPDTIDPLMLGPQPLPKPKVNRDEVAVVCYLCRTRMYAPIAQIGQTIKCPDCHSVNEVKAPKELEKKKPGPTLDDAPDFGLNDPGDRPAYRPIVAPRGEYSALAEFDPAQRPAGWSHPSRSDAEPATAVARQADDDDDDHVEITIAAPVERIELKPEIKPLPPPDPDEDMYDGKYDDGLIGDHVDRSQPQAWKKAPLVIGILGFLFYTSTIPRLILYVVGLIFAICVFHTAVNYGSSEDLSEKVAAIFFSGLSVVSLGFWVASFAAVLLSIVQDTANGQDDVTSYPDWNIVDWIMTSAYFPAAAFVAGLPGSIFTVTLISIGLDPTYGAVRRRRTARDELDRPLPAGALLDARRGFGHGPLFARHLSQHAASERSLGLFLYVCDPAWHSGEHLAVDDRLPWGKHHFLHPACVRQSWPRRDGDPLLPHSWPADVVLVRKNGQARAARRAPPCRRGGLVPRPPCRYIHSSITRPSISRTGRPSGEWAIRSVGMPSLA